jgi:hypothetical protein
MAGHGSSGGLNPEEADEARRTRPLTIQEKRNLLSTRRNEPGTFRVEAPEPSGARIETILVRLGLWLQQNEVSLTVSALERIASADLPWVVLSQFIQDDEKFELVKETVTALHDEEWRVGFMLDSGRLSFQNEFIPAGDPRRDPNRKPLIPGGDVQPLPETGDDDARRYADERNRLVNEEGLTPFQAHRLLKEWGFLNPYLPGADQDADLENFAGALAIMRANGEYTGEILPEDIIVMGSVEAGLQLLEDTGYEGSLETFDNFEEVLVNEFGLGEDPESASTNAQSAALGRPPELDLGAGDEDDRRPIGAGLSPDFVLRIPPRESGSKRATPNRPGFLPGDRDALLESGSARGRDLVGEAVLEGTTQGIEYWENDNSNIFVGLTFEAIMLYQTMLVDAGWLDPDDFKEERGRIGGGSATWTAMAQAMEASNRTDAVTWIEAAQRAAFTREKNDADAVDRDPIPVWTPGVYLAPDPDFLSQVVKTTFRSLLGREPSASEVRALASSLGGEFKGVFDAEEAQAFAEFEQGIAASDLTFGPIDPETGKRTGPGKLEEGETFKTTGPIESLTGVDATASFLETFEARFKEELSRGRGRIASRDARRDVMGSIFAIDAAVGGGR